MLSSGKSALRGILAMVALAMASSANSFVPGRHSGKKIKHASGSPRRGHSGDKLARKAAEGSIGIRRGW